MNLIGRLFDLRGKFVKEVTLSVAPGEPPPIVYVDPDFELCPWCAEEKLTRDAAKEAGGIEYLRCTSDSVNDFVDFRHFGPIYRPALSETVRRRLKLQEGAPGGQ